MKPLVLAHSHNDYLQPRPLFDALDLGFCSVEADIFYDDGGLGVAHEEKDLRSDRNLDTLYLAPLWARFRRYGRIHPEPAPFTLLVDIKSDAERVWPALEALLARYRPMLTVWDGARTRRGAVSVILSGDRPIRQLAAAPIRCAALDGRPSDLGTGALQGLYPLISQSWYPLFGWSGVGPMNTVDRRTLTDLVTRTHGERRALRFWGAPDTPAVWALQRAAGVDRINTDRLADLAEFLRS